MKKKVSLIIPSYNDNNKLTKLLSSLNTWQAIPNEIIIVDSSQNKFSISKDFKKFIKKFSIRFLLIHKKNLFPGHSRNIGIINSTNSLLAFLDTSTFPTVNWLSSGLKIIEKNDSEGVWGNTYYQSLKYISKIIRACTVGEKPIKTLPGTILKKNVFNRCGLFIESVRAGEDGDWRSRVELHKINMSDPKEILIYNKLNFISLKELLKKWFRNYNFTFKLPFSRAHKDFYYYGISIFFVLIAFNWNKVFASWNENSVLYLPNITKITVLIIFISYVLFRGVFLPKIKGVSYKFIFPINFISIVILSAFLDSVKVAAYIYSRLKNE